MPKPVSAPLTGPRVRLRLLTEADLPQTLAWRNQDHIRRWFFFSDVITPEQHAAWYAKYAAKADDVVFIIEALPEGRPIGQVALYDIDRERGEAEFGRIFIGAPEAAGRGYARAATDLIVQGFGFGQLGLKRIYLEVLPDNAAAIAVYEKCGFVRLPADSADAPVRAADTPLRMEIRASDAE